MRVDPLELLPGATLLLFVDVPFKELLTLVNPLTDAFVTTPTPLDTLLDTLRKPWAKFDKVPPFYKFYVYEFYVPLY